MVGYVAPLHVAGLPTLRVAGFADAGDAVAPNIATPSTKALVSPVLRWNMTSLPDVARRVRRRLVDLDLHSAGNPAGSTHVRYPCRAAFMPLRYQRASSASIDTRRGDEKGSPHLRGGVAMSESVYKVIELVGTSTESWEKAAAAAVSKAASSLRDLRI